MSLNFPTCQLPTPTIVLRTFGLFRCIVRTVYFYTFTTAAAAAAAAVLVLLLLLVDAVAVFSWRWRLPSCPSSIQV